MQDFYRRPRKETKFEWPPKRSAISGVLFGVLSGGAMALVAGLVEGNWALGIFMGAVFALFGGPFFAVRMKKAGIDDGSISTEAVAKEWSDRHLVLAAVVVVAGGLLPGQQVEYRERSLSLSAGLQAHSYSSGSDLALRSHD